MAVIEQFAAGQRLTAGGLNAATMGGMILFRAYRGALQNISTGADTAANSLQWDPPDIDRVNGWVSGSPALWTCQNSGYYKLDGSVSFAGSSAGTIRDASWYINGALFSAGRARSFDSSSIATQPLTVEARSLPLFLSAGDTVALVPSHDAGVTLGTATGSLRPFMAVTHAGPV